MLAASEQLDHLVDNLLDLSRLQAGAAQPDQGLVELEELVIAALGEVGDEAARAEVTFGEGSPTVLVDPHQIQRVLVNLIENALKYSPADEPIRVQVVGDPVGGGRPRDRPRARRAGGGARAHLRAVPARIARRKRSGCRPRPRDRTRLRGGERRPADRRVALRPGRDLRARRSRRPARRFRRERAPRSSSSTTSSRSCARCERACAARATTSRRPRPPRARSPRPRCVHRRP